MAAQTDNVVAFPDVRVATELAMPIIGASLEEEPCSAHHVFGVSDQMNLQSLSRVLTVIPGWGDGNVPTRSRLPGSAVESATQSVTGDRPAVVGVVDVSLSTTITEMLQGPGDTLIWQWGLWEHTLQIGEASAHDEATPDALCIGGSDLIRALGGVDAEESVNIAAINRELTRRDSTQNTLATARADVVDIIGRPEAFELVPLLQALDPQRSESIAPELTGEAGGSVVKRLRVLPIEDAERDPAGHGTALVELLCLTALTSDELRHNAAAHVMEHLGQESNKGIPLSGEDVEELAAASWAEIGTLELAEEDAFSPVERLDPLRKALRH